jgi:hypothetical protein
MLFSDNEDFKSGTGKLVAQTLQNSTNDLNIIGERIKKYSDKHAV